MSRPLYGDPLLVDELRSSAAARRAEHLIQRTARCWDRFGLPDGTRNPGRRPSTDGMSVCLTPSEEQIHAAMNGLLREVVEERDHWLLDIPRVLLPARSSAEILVSRRGAAMGLPWSAFGSLFFTNFLSQFLQGTAQHEGRPELITTWRAKRARWRLRRRVPRDLCRLAFTHWLTGEPISGRPSLAVQRLEDALTLAMKTADLYGDRSIWTMTTFQQAILVLHEFGHVAGLPAPVDDTTAHHHSIAAELAADAWGLPCARRLARRLFGPPSTGSAGMARALLCLFSALEFTEYPDRRDPRREDMARRCGAFIRALAGSSEYAELPDIAVVDFFESMRELYEARLPAMVLFVVHDQFLQQFSRNGITYENDAVRRMAEPSMTPWGLV